MNPQTYTQESIAATSDDVSPLQGEQPKYKMSMIDLLTFFVLWKLLIANAPSPALSAVLVIALLLLIWHEGKAGITIQRILFMTKTQSPTDIVCPVIDSAI